MDNIIELGGMRSSGEGRVVLFPAMNHPGLLDRVVRLWHRSEPLAPVISLGVVRTARLRKRAMEAVRKPR